MDSSDWICPHCGRSHSNLTACVVRCLDCRQVYPLSKPIGRDERWGENHREDETVTDRWPGIDAERYEFVRILGSGAQGKILLARHRHLDQLCVIKVLAIEDDEWAEVAIARLQNEARAGVRVNHVNVARVLDCDCVEGRWYFVMEHIEGMNLREVLHEIDALDWTQVVQVGLQAAAGLTAIHDVQLVHRDIKPGNLMMRPDGVVKIMDLGLVKIRNTPASLSVTRAGQWLGTPNYMPPEQFDTESAVDTRADLYALGGTLYHLATGRPPFEATGVLGISEQHRRAPVTWVDSVKQAVPAWLRHTIERCLAKRPGDRFASAAELADALRAGADASGTGRDARLALSRAAPVPAVRPRGLAVLSFRNLSGDAANDWIGEALAEYLTNRLMELQEVFVADRRSLVAIMDRQQDRGAEPSEASGEGHRLDADAEGILEAGRLVGAGTVILGSFQRSGDELRVAAHYLGGASGQPTLIGNFAGQASKLFDLQDSIAEKVLLLAGRGLRGPRRRFGGAGGTDNLEAHEQYMRSRRAFADGDYRKAIDLAEQALALDPQYFDPVSFIGACWARLGKYDQAVEYHERQERMAREVGDEPRLAEALENLGAMYYYKGEYPLAYEFLDNARNLAARLDLKADTAKYDDNLGFVLMRLDRFDEARDAFARGIEACKECGDLASLVLPYNGMGTVLLKQQRYAEAREHYQRALALAEEIGDRVNVGVSLMNLGRCACLLKDYEEARRRFEASLSTLEGTDFWNGLTLVYEYMAEMHLEQQDVEAAVRCVDRRIELASRHGNNRMEAQAWEQKARAHELLGQTDQALDCLKRSVEVSQRPAPYESLHRYLDEVANRKAFH